MRLLQDNPANVNNAVSKEKVATEAKIRRCDSDFDTHCRHDECLVVGKTDSVEKQSQVKIATLVWSINPAEQEQQHRHERGHAEGVDLDDHGLAPHETVVAD